ncbi:MAG: sugar phosphate isomerase/epimerase [Cyclobacteriaceae bacterium]|jgi:sugar phosphate isomerase/epimerase
MKLALNTLVYEVGAIPPDQSLKSAARFGFKYIEYAGIRQGNPTTMSSDMKKNVINIFKDNGLVSSQMLLVATKDTSSSDIKKRQATMDYLKACGDFQKELGGRQMLVCWGGGLYELGMKPEDSWKIMVEQVRHYAEWCLERDLIVGLELDPHVYFIINNTYKMAKAIEDIGMPNVYPNVDVGHLVITREEPAMLEKLAPRLLHIHLSETESLDHTNDILGTGVVDFKAYVDKCIELGIEENCKRWDEPCVAGIEMGSEASGGFVDEPDRWVQQSLDYLAKTIPELTM